MSGEEYGGGKELLMIWSVPPHVIAWACMAAGGTGSLVFFDDVTKAVGWILKCRAILSAHIQPNASTCIGKFPTIYLESNTRVSMEKHGFFYSDQSITWPTEHVYHLPKLKAICFTNNQELQTALIKPKHLQGRNLGSGDV